MTTIVLIEAKFNRFLTDALAMEAQQQGIKIDVMTDASGDEAMSYRPSVIPCVMAVRDCGCKIIEIAEPLELAKFHPLVDELAGLPCNCSLRKITMIRGRLRELLLDRLLENEIGAGSAALDLIDSEIATLKSDLSGLEGG